MLEAISRSMDARGGGYESGRRPQAGADAARGMKQQIGEVRSFRAMLAAYSGERLSAAQVSVSTPARG